MGISNMLTGQLPAQDGQTAVLLLSDIVESSRLWGWSRIVKGPRALRAVPGLVFSKVLGSGHEGGFGLRPSASRQGLFALFESAQAAANFVAYSSLVQAYRDRSREFCWVTLQTWSCRGSWDGLSLEVLAEQPSTIHKLLSHSVSSRKLTLSVSILQPRYWLIRLAGTKPPRVSPTT